MLVFNKIENPMQQYIKVQCNIWKYNASYVVFQRNAKMVYFGKSISVIHHINKGQVPCNQ